MRGIARPVFPRSLDPRRGSHRAALGPAQGQGRHRPLARRIDHDGGPVRGHAPFEIEGRHPRQHPRILHRVAEGVTEDIDHVADDAVPVLVHEDLPEVPLPGAPDQLVEKTPLAPGLGAEGENVDADAGLFEARNQIPTDRLDLYVPGELLR